MPRTKFQNLFFRFLMVLISVHVFAIYNTAISMGSISDNVFSIASKRIGVLFIIAFLLTSLIIIRTAKKIAFTFVDPKIDRPIMITLAMTCSMVLLMCPSMSFISTLLYNGTNHGFLTIWLHRMAYNFPFALFIQLLVIGPFVRFIFGTIFKAPSQTRAVS